MASPKEKLGLLGIKGNISERSLYRTIEKVGRLSQLLMTNYQEVISKNGLVDTTQLSDFSSSYFEGQKAIINLTLKLCKKPDVKNLKLLKKYLGNLTLTIIYPKNGFIIGL